MRPSLTHTECSGAQTAELKAGPLRTTSTFPSFSRNTWSVSYEPGIVVFSGGVVVEGKEFCWTRALFPEIYTNNYRKWENVMGIIREVYRKCFRTVS